AGPDGRSGGGHRAARTLGAGRWRALHAGRAAIRRRDRRLWAGRTLGAGMSVDVPHTREAMSKWILCVGMIAWGAGLRAQVLHPAGGGVRSVITYSECGPGVSVDFSSAYVAPLTYQFTPENEVSGLITWTTAWMMAHIDGWATEQLGPELTQTFPQAGDHLVCLEL